MRFSFCNQLFLAELPGSRDKTSTDPVRQLRVLRIQRILVILHIHPKAFLTWYGQVHDGRRSRDGRPVHVLQVQASCQAVLCDKVAPHMDKVICLVSCPFTKRKLSLLAADCDHLPVSLITDITLRFLQGSYPNSDVERLQTQCFKSVWVATALHQVRRSESFRSDYWSDY